MNGSTIGNLILVTLVCVVIFVVFMALRPAPGGETPVYGPDGKYQGSVHDYGRMQTYTDRNGHFATTAIAQAQSVTVGAPIVACDSPTGVGCDGRNVLRPGTY